MARVPRKKKKSSFSRTAQSPWNCCEITVNSFGKGRGEMVGTECTHVLFCGNGESDIPQSFTSASSLPSATLCVETFRWSASSCVKLNTKFIQEAAILKKKSPQLFVIRTFRQSLSSCFCPTLLRIKEIFTPVSYAALRQKHIFVHPCSSLSLHLSLFH